MTKVSDHPRAIKKIQSLLVMLGKIELKQQG